MIFTQALWLNRGQSRKKNYSQKTIYFESAINRETAWSIKEAISLLLLYSTKNLNKKLLVQKHFG